MATIKLHGMRELKKELRKLEPRMAKNILRGSVRAIAAEIRDEARANAPVETGNLKRNIISKGRRGRRGSIRASVIAREEGKRGDKKNAFYWRFVEFGHFDRGGNQIPGRPFITEAYESMRGRIVQTMRRYAQKRIRSLVKK